MLLPPHLVQTVRKVKTCTDMPMLEVSDIPKEFHEEKSELLLRLADDSTTTKAAVLGIDPDSSGAVAILNLDLEDGSTLEMLKSADVSIYDMPVELVPTAKRFRR